MRPGWIGLGSLVVLLGSVTVPERHDPPTWARDVAPLVRSQCAPCHSKDGHGPFALETYRDVTRRSELVRQELLKRTMPPCIAESDFGAFCTTRRLSDDELVMLQDWFSTGMAQGEGDVPPSVQEHGFRLGKPDLTLTPFVEPTAPSEGNPVWCAVLIDPKNKAPLHVRGFDVVPKSPLIVRQVLLAVASSSVKTDHWSTNGTLDANSSRFIGAWAPGYPAWQLPEGVSMQVNPGEKLVAQILVVPGGREMSPSIEVGLYLSKASHNREARWLTMQKRDFRIAAFDEVTLTTSMTVDRDVEALAIVPEARFFCYAMNIYRVAGDERKLLFRTNKWNPYWNGAFVFRKPVRIDAGMKVESNMIFENEQHTLINEGRQPRDVFSGPALNEEVCRTHILVADVAGR